jgi:hypothetical protein
MILASCLNFEDDSNEPKAVVSITNYTLEKLKIDSDEYFLSKKIYDYIDIEETSKISVKLDKTITAIGDVSGKNYGSRSFPFEGEYTWGITGASTVSVKLDKMTTATGDISVKKTRKQKLPL